MNWKLDIPVAYQVGEIGEDDFIGGFEENSLHRLTLYMIYNPSGFFRPSPKPEGELDRTHGFFINLRNEPFHLSGIPFIKAQGRILQCLRSIDIASMIGVSRTEEQCSINDGRVRCNVDLNYKGWRVDIRMPKAIYMTEYLLYCRKVADFLDGLTVEIDEIEPTRAARKN